MYDRSFAKLALLGGAVLLFVLGCPNPTPPENALTWGIKAATGRLTETTPREWQAVVGRVDEYTPDVELSLTDAEAGGVVDFLQANQLDSIPQIVGLVQSILNDPNSIGDMEVPESVLILFGDAGIDFEAAVAGLLFGT